MHNRLKALVFGLSIMMAGAGAFAADKGSADEAVAMVKKAVVYMKENGKDKAFAEFGNAANTQFHDRDLYIFVYDFDGNCLAQGANPKMVGKNLIGLKDTDGNELIKGEIALVKGQGSGWYGPYKFSNPVTGKIETKRSFCMRGAGDSMVCAGVYSGH